MWQLNFLGEVVEDEMINDNLGGGVTCFIFTPTGGDDSI